jgi:hypothetical protein
MIAAKMARKEKSEEEDVHFPRLYIRRDARTTGVRSGEE